MTLESDLTASILVCVSPTFTFPSVTEAGFPTIILGCMGSMLGGLNLLVDYLPPNDPPDFTVPDIQIFLDAFFAAAVGMPSFPAITLDILGVEINLPTHIGVTPPQIPDLNGVPLPQFDPATLVKMVGMFIGLPFILIQEILDSLITPPMVIPDHTFIVDLIEEIGVSLGFTVPEIAQFAACLATGIVGMIAEIFP